MNNNTFFSSKNKDLLYNICRDELIKQTEYNIDDNKKYYRTFGEIMGIVFKHADDTNNLTQLNKSVLGKTIPYLKTDIDKKRLTNAPLLPPNSLRKMTKNKYENLKGDMAENNGLPISFRGSSTNTSYENVNVNSDYKQLMDNRKDYYSNQEQMSNGQNGQNRQNSQNGQNGQNGQNRQNGQNGQIPVNSKDEVNEDPKVSMERLMKEREGLSNDNNTEEYTLDPMSLNSDLVNNEIGTTVEHMNTYDSTNDEVDPMKLYQQYNNEREIQDSEYNKIQEDRNNFEDANKGNNEYITNILEENKVKSIVEENKFHDNLSLQINEQMSRANLGDLKGQLDDQLDFATQNKKAINLPTANDLAIAQNNNIYENNALFEEFKKSLFNTRKYINRENLITINSGDRDWFNNTTETRFSFQVKFNPSVTSTDLNGTEYVGSTSAGLPQEYKNVTSIEMVRVLMAVENILLPFDNRISIDYKSLPYIVLKIDEIDGLYSGTNQNIDKAFAHLLWDKDNGSDINNINMLQQYSRQFKRGYCLMAPLGFEKKTYYPSPLSSLNRLTLNLSTPSGQKIYNHPDVLKIKTIKMISIPVEDDSTNSIVNAVAPTANKIFTLPNYQGGISVSAPQRISLTASATLTPTNFIITGKNNKGSVISEIIPGPLDTTAVYSSLRYASITSFISDVAPTTGANTISVGNEGVIDLEIGDTSGFPYDVSKRLIEIQTFTYFSNKVLKIGDNIKIQGFVDESADTFDINSFINREEGHYIINLEKQDNNKATSENEGFISKLYISPPGEINFSEETSTSILINESSKADADTTFYEDDTGSADTTKNCKLINQSLQSNYVFKVVTREDDVTNVLSNSNI
jgi:hypothetical protein